MQKVSLFSKFLRYKYIFQTTKKQLIKLWYNMKAKAREAKKSKDSIGSVTNGCPGISELEDGKVMEVDENVMTYVKVDIDSDLNGMLIARCEIYDVQMRPIKSLHLQFELGHTLNIKIILSHCLYKMFYGCNYIYK